MQLARVNTVDKILGDIFFLTSFVILMDTEWGGKKIPAFQNHCVSICQDSNGNFITKDEAHYICGILNSHIVEDYILSSSDKRTFKVRLPIKILKYDAKNKLHVKLSNLSKEAHDKCHDEVKIENIRNEIDKLYMSILK